MLVVPAWAFAVVDLYFECRRRAVPGAFGPGPAALPCGGGVGEQPAALMDAFALIESWRSD